ncbi:hypothetical protein WJX73_004121 [Symbiochloris irregularis]|uniref:Uncharacterized protein n=1 Tax=Symbiochloris irregularis TaxID=706552 RepID=A0AAW1PC34_9CHLO
MPQKPASHNVSDPKGLQRSFLTIFCPALPEFSADSWRIARSCLEELLLHGSVILVPLSVWNVTAATGLLSTVQLSQGTTALRPTDPGVAVAALCLLLGVLWRIDHYRKAKAVRHRRAGTTLSGGAYRRWLQLQESMRQSLPSIPKVVKPGLPGGRGSSHDPVRSKAGHEKLV